MAARYSTEPTRADKPRNPPSRLPAELAPIGILVQEDSRPAPLFRSPLLFVGTRANAIPAGAGPPPG